MSEPQFHPLSTLFPAVEGRDFDLMVEDIRVNGLRQAITLYRGEILDGRTRYLACRAAEVEPRFETYMGDDPVRYVVSLNVARRHLDESQRAMVAAKIASLSLGDNQHSQGMPIGRASELLNVGERSVARAREVLDAGSPALRDAVERGEASVSAAAEIAQRPHAEQAEIVACGRAEIVRMANVFREEDMRRRREKRDGAAAALRASEADPAREREYHRRASQPWEIVPWNGTHRLIESYDDFVGAMIAQRHARGLTQLELDALAGWGDGFASRLEAWQGPKGRVAGAISIVRWWNALGIRMLPVSIDGGSLE